MILIIYLHSNSILNTKYPVINLAKGKKSGDKSELILVKDYSCKDLSETNREALEGNENTADLSKLSKSIYLLEQRITNIENYLGAF